MRLSHTRQIGRRAVCRKSEIQHGRPKLVTSLLDISKVKAGREPGEQVRHECICLTVERLNVLSPEAFARERIESGA